MCKDPCMDANELVNLEAENAERLNDLIRGKHGIAVQLQPGTFELIQITTYLEHLLVLCDHEGSEDSLYKAKIAFAEKTSDLLTSLELQARRAKITNPGSVVEGKFPQQ